MSGYLETVIERTLPRRAFLKVSAAAVCAAGLIPLLSACGGDDESDPTAPSGDATSVPQSTAATAPTVTQPASTDPTSVPLPNVGGKLIVARSADADTLDPAFTSRSDASFVFINIYDPLLGYNAAMEYEPILAESWEVSDDGQQYTWMLRDGISFHDGSPLNAEAVKFTFERIIDPATASVQATDLAPLTGVDVVDERTARFTLSEPLSPMFGTLATEYFGVLSPSAVTEMGDSYGQHPVGTGPFKFKEWVVDDQITLARNEDYQDFYSYNENKGAPYLDEIVFKVLPEEQTQVAAFEAGDIHVLSIPAQQADRFEDNPDYHFYKVTGANIWYLDINLSESGGQAVYGPPFDDLRTRQAVAHAVNVEEIIDGLLGGFAIRNEAPMMAANFASRPDMGADGYDYDPDRAMALLDEAGWTADGDGPRQKDGQALEAVLWTFTDSTNDRVAQLIQAQLQQVGFSVTLQSVEGGAFSDGIMTDQWDLYLAGIAWSEPDILLDLSTRGRPGLGVYGKHNTALRELLENARTVSDLDERAGFYEEAYKLILADAVVVPLYSVEYLTATRSSVDGFKVGPRGIWVYQDIQLDA